MAACSAGTDSGGVFDGSDGGAGGASAAGGTANGGSDAGGSLNIGGIGGSNTTDCITGTDDDADNDGYTTSAGDCNDCDPNVNPAAVEVVAVEDEMGNLPEAVDEDCDGTVDNVAGLCDTGLLLASPDPLDGVKAADLCKMKDPSDPKDSGVISAAYVLVDGNPAPADPDFHLGYGLLDAFGPNVNVQAGDKMLALSSGSARQPTDPGYMPVSGFSKGFSSGHPQGFPKESPSCPGVTTGTPYDGTALEVTIKVPSNAYGFSFDFNFYTYEWPGFVCSQYNDFFVALLNPTPMGQIDGNISFDSMGNPVSVNNAFLEVCGCASGPPCFAGGKTFDCALGNTTLIGTGFGADTAGSDHGSTMWLQTQAPVEPNSLISLRWGTYDSGDGSLDSTTLIDNFTWIAESGTTLGTTPVPTPK